MVSFEKLTPAELSNRLLSAAAEYNPKDITRLLKAGANPNAIISADSSAELLSSPNRREGEAVLEIVCVRGPKALPVVEELIAAGSKIPESGMALLNAVQGSAYNADLDASPLIGALISAGSDANKGHSNGRVPLFNTILYRDADISETAVKALLKHGANPNAVVHYEGRDPQDILTTMTWHATWVQGKSEDANRAFEAVKALLDA